MVLGYPDYHIFSVKTSSHESKAELNTIMLHVMLTPIIIYISCPSSSAGSVYPPLAVKEKNMDIYTAGVHSTTPEITIAAALGKINVQAAGEMVSLNDES